MRIVILSSFPPLRGGISQFNASLYKALEEKGHEVLGLSFSVQYPNLLFPGKRQDVDRVNTEHQIQTERLLHSFKPSTWKKTAKRIDAFQADLVIVPYWVSVLAPSLTGVLTRLTHSTKVLGLIHNAAPHEAKFYDKPLFKRFSQNLDGAIVLSESVKEQLKETCPKLPILELRHPIYTHFGEPLSLENIKKLKDHYSLDEHKTTLLYFGLIREYKGLKVLLEAFKELPSDFQLLIVGEVYGDARHEVDSIQHHPRAKDIHFENRFVEDDEVAGIFSMSDLVVLPYLRASQSGVTAVAIHFEKPIVASNVGGLSEFILVDETGVLVEENNVKQLIEGILKAKDLKPKDAWTRLKSMFSWSSFVDNILIYMDK